MALVSTYPVMIEWGDCDPAQVVFYPNYFIWLDAATNVLIEAAGWPYARLVERFGIIGLPLAEASARFLRPSRFRQRLEIKSSVENWEERRFTVLHRAFRDDTLLLEGRETRFCGAPHPDDAQRLRALPIPLEFKQAFDK
jgi:4-hydroxybenzoyl-CoA thioesterase